MAAWPSELPQSPESIAERPQLQVLRTQMDAGPAKQRRRFSAAARRHSVRYLMDLSQRRIFEDWFNNELHGGALEFDWRPSRQQAAVAARIVGNDPPYQITSAGSALWWHVSMEIEELP